MFVVLGIGNPDEKYAATRHNVGWMTADALSGKMDAKFRKAGFEFWAAEGRLGRHRLAVVKTWTYVNETGRVIPELRKRFELSDGSLPGGKPWVPDLMVVTDDVNLGLGAVRIRAEGSSGGHNGLKSVEAALGHAGYPRLRIGVGGGRPDPGYVLGRFGKSELPVVEETVAHACAALRCWMDEGVEKCMTRYNRKPPGDGGAGEGGSGQ
jgi:PTH1 family peptidyl-tRNA hydrolase